MRRGDDEERKKGGKERKEEEEESGHRNGNKWKRISERKTCEGKEGG